MGSMTLAAASSGHIGDAKRTREEVIAALQPRYVWWELDGSAIDRRRRVLAQIMDLGTYDDIRAIEAVFDRDELVDVLAHAQPGWLSARSWDFWRGRLSLSSDDAIPAKPPQRSFDAGLLRTGA
jgi:hypothetical protein